MKKLFKVLLVHSFLLGVLSGLILFLIGGASTSTRSSVKPLFMAISGIVTVFAFLFPYASFISRHNSDWRMRKSVGIGFLPVFTIGLMLLVVMGGFDLLFSPVVPIGAITFAAVSIVTTFLFRGDQDFWEVNIPYLMILILLVGSVTGALAVNATDSAEPLIEKSYNPGGNYNSCLNVVETRCKTVGGVFEKPESCERAEGMDERIREMGYSVNSSHISCNG